MIFLIPYSFCLKLKAFCTRIYRQFETLFFKSSFQADAPEKFGQRDLALLNYETNLLSRMFLFGSGR